jgi:hypothetical protein
VGAGSFAVAFWNVDGSFNHPVRDALRFAAFWVFFAAIGAWLILFAVRWRLHITHEHLQQIGCFRTSLVRWSDISSAKWRLFPNDSLELTAPNCRIVIDFQNLTLHDRRPVILHLRETIPATLQEGWDKFAGFALPSPPSAKKTKTIRMVGSILFLTFAVLFASCWAMRLGTQHLWYAALNLFAALWTLRPGRKKDGKTLCE